MTGHVDRAAIRRRASERVVGAGEIERLVGLGGSYRGWIAERERVRESSEDVGAGLAASSARTVARSSGAAELATRSEAGQRRERADTCVDARERMDPPVEA